MRCKYTEWDERIKNKEQRSKTQIAASKPVGYPKAAVNSLAILISDPVRASEGKILQPEVYLRIVFKSRSRQVVCTGNLLQFKFPDQRKLIGDKS
jgi:hypothetical protein